MKMSEHEGNRFLEENTISQLLSILQFFQVHLS